MNERKRRKGRKVRRIEEEINILIEYKYVDVTPDKYRMNMGGLLGEEEYEEEKRILGREEERKREEEKSIVYNNNNV